MHFLKTFGDVELLKLMKTGLHSLILGLLLVAALSAHCPLPFNSQSQIYSDSVGLTAQDNGNGINSQNLIFNYAYDQSFSSSPNIAIGLNEIQSSESPYLEIQIGASKVTPDAIYFQAKSGEESKWKSLKVNFLASTRSDIEIGVASVTNPLVGRDNSFDLAYSIKSDVASSGLKVKSFLQGVSLESRNKQSIGIKQNEYSVVGKTVYFTFASIQQSSIIHSLTISIIVFNVYTPGILYADGTIDQNYVVSKTQINIPKHGINELRTYIVGINSFDTSAAKPITISTAIDETFTLVIGPIDRNEIDYISVSYLILSVVDCGSCSGFPLLFDGLCRPNCPPGTHERNGRCIPIDCTAGFELSPDGLCIPKCEANQVFDGKTCICIDGFYVINRKCAQCAVSEYYDFKVGACRPLCGPNSYYQGGRCYCKPGFNIINGGCQQCPYGSSYNSYEQRCVDICGWNQVYSPQGCVCKNGYYLINGKCDKCPYQKVYNPHTSSCDCPYGLELVFGFCQPVCPANEVRVNNICQCKYGFYRIDGYCISCPPHSTYDAVKVACVCKPPYMLMNGECVPSCRDNYYFDAQNEVCVAYCSQYLEEYVNGKCVCVSDYERARNGTCIASCLFNQVRNVLGVCECMQGYTNGGGFGPCYPANCPYGTYWNSTRQDCLSNCGALQIFINGACVCQQGYQSDNIYGDCIAECTQFQVRENGYCRCADGYKQVDNGICIPDTGNSFCPLGQTFDPITRSCRCELPKVWVMGFCQFPNVCGPNEYWCVTSCICNNGFYRVGGVCVPVPPTPECPPNSVGNGVNCMCNQGFYPVRPGVCERCPYHTIWDGRACVKEGDQCQNGYKWDNNQGCCIEHRPTCLPNQHWDGVACRCDHGFFWIQGRCQTCPYGSVFDGMSCNYGNVIGKTCIDPYSFYNGRECVCLPNYFPLLNNRCVGCPEGTHWDGTCCKVHDPSKIPPIVW